MRYWIEDNIVLVVIVSLILTITITRILFAYRDIETLEREAPKWLIEQGYIIEGSQNGYAGDIYYGGEVFFLVRRKEQPEYLYEITVVEWDGVLQCYTPDLVNVQIIK